MLLSKGAVPIQLITANLSRPTPLRNVLASLNIHSTSTEGDKTTLAAPATYVANYNQNS